MADHRPEQSKSDTNRETSTEISSKCYEYLRMLVPICLMTACFGFVLLLSGIISLIAFDGGKGRAIIAGIGCVVVVISTAFYIVVKVRLGKMNCNLGYNNRGMNSMVEYAYWDTSPLVIVAVKNKDKLCHGESQPVPEHRSPFPREDFVPIGSTALMRPSVSLEQSSLFEDEELFRLNTADDFEIPPTYEEATVGMASTTIQGQD